MSRELCLRSRQRTRAVDLPLLRRIARHLLSRHFGRDQFALAIHLVANPEMARLNEQFLGHAGSTDVITFDLQNEAGAPCGLSSPLPKSRAQGLTLPLLLHGEIFISIDRALEQARDYRTTWQEELTRYVIHGLLHLHGYDDLTPGARRNMKRLENRLLRDIAATFDLSGLTREKRGSRSRSRPQP